MTMLKNKDINLIRDAAIKLEKTDLEMAHDLMAIAHRTRPGGPFIKKKLLEYQERLEALDPEIIEKSKLRDLVSSGELVIIPIGFRCHTKGFIFNKLGVKPQASLPFDSGFFSPNAVASVLNYHKVELSFDGVGENHFVCVKTENNDDEQYGLGIKFETSTYEDINAVATSRNVPGINKYLDSTFGFYTLDVKHQFVLAHYNWHPLSSDEKSKGIVDPAENLQIINSMMDRRIQRMMELIENAKHVFFVFGENQNYSYLQIDDSVCHLDDFDRLHTVCVQKFGDKFTIVKNIQDGSFSASEAISCLN
jgi:hypothetical protein